MDITEAKKDITNINHIVAKLNAISQTNAKIRANHETITKLFQQLETLGQKYQYPGQLSYQIEQIFVDIPEPDKITDLLESRNNLLKQIEILETMPGTETSETYQTINNQVKNIINAIEYLEEVLKLNGYEIRDLLTNYSGPIDYAVVKRKTIPSKFTKRDSPYLFVDHSGIVSYDQMIILQENTSKLVEDLTYYRYGLLATHSVPNNTAVLIYPDNPKHVAREKLNLFFYGLYQKIDEDTKPLSMVSSSGQTGGDSSERKSVQNLRQYATNLKAFISDSLAQQVNLMEMTNLQFSDHAKSLLTLVSYYLGTANRYDLELIKYCRSKNFDETMILAIMLVQNKSDLEQILANYQPNYYSMLLNISRLKKMSNLIKFQQNYSMNNPEQLAILAAKAKHYVG